MNPEQPDHVQRTLADLEARLGRINDEVAQVRAGLASLRGQAPGSAPTTPPQQPWRPASVHQPPRQPQSQRRPKPRKTPRLTPATVIAAIGGAVMLAGIAFLLVVAIQAGLFPPIARVIGAAILGAVLVGLGLRLQSRHEPTGDRPINPGALALVGTGLAAAMLDVIASATLYEWIPVPAAYMFVGVLALAGMVLAQRWSSSLLACLVAAGTMALAPLISHGVELPIFFAIVGIATAVLAAELGVVVRIVWSVLPAFMLTGYLSASGSDGPSGQWALVVAALVFAAVGVGVACYDTLGRTPAVENAALVVAPTAVPLLALPTVDVVGTPVVAGLILAALYLAVAVVAVRFATTGTTAKTGAEATRADEPRSAPTTLLTTVTGSVGSVLLVAAWGHLGSGHPVTIALTLTAIGYVVAAGLWARRWVGWAAGAITALALLAYLVVTRPFYALSHDEAVDHFGYWDVVSSLVVTALAVAATWWAVRRRPTESSRVVMAGAVVALVTVSVLIVSAGVVVGDLADSARNGFLAAHLVVTVLWICCAAWLVLTAAPRIADARRLGFVLGALALAKLLLLDLATLPGLFRVISFIVVGAVMLAVAVRYRGSGGIDDDDNTTTPAPPTPAGEPAGGGGAPGYRSDTDPSGSGSPT